MLVRFHQCYACRTILARQIVGEPIPDLPELYEGDWRGSHLRPPTLRSELVPLADLSADGLPRFGLRSTAQRRRRGSLRQGVRSRVTVVELGVLGSGRPTRIEVREPKESERPDDRVLGDPPIWFPTPAPRFDREGAPKSAFPSVGDEALVYCVNCGRGQVVRRVLLTDRAEELPQLDATAPLPPDPRCRCRCGCTWLPPGAGFWPSGVCGPCTRGLHTGPFADDVGESGTL
jgi:hypothetical protein